MALGWYWVPITSRGAQTFWVFNRDVAAVSNDCGLACAERRRDLAVNAEFGKCRISKDCCCFVVNSVHGVRLRLSLPQYISQIALIFLQST